MTEHKATVEAAVSLHDSIRDSYDFMCNLRRTHHTSEHQAEILGVLDKHLKEALWYANLYKIMMEPLQDNDGERCYHGSRRL